MYMQMRNIFVPMMAAVIMASCADDGMVAPRVPSCPGSEVDFSPRLSRPASSTRTVYGDEDSLRKVFPVYWVDGDRVSMASPGAAVDRAVYSIKVDKVNQDFATSMDKDGDAGIQWGNTLPQNFYSVYPVKYTDISGREVENTLAIQGNKVEATLHVRPVQRQLFELTTTSDGKRVWKGTPVDETGMKCPDAIMYAQKRMETDGTVALEYIPFTTAFHITLDGYGLGVGVDEETAHVVIQEVVIEAPEGVNLVGSFKAVFDEEASVPPTVDVGVNDNAAPNRIRVPMMSDATDYLHPEPGTDAISFNVYAIPTTGTEVGEDWTLSVRTNYRTYTRKLKPSTTGAGALAQGMVHKLGLPSFLVVNDDLNQDLTKWMQGIPRNVYITDLSLPGAWYSRQKQYQGTAPGGGDWTIQELWERGVRAFSVETRSSSSTIVKPNDPSSVVISGTGTNRGTGNNKYYYRGTPVANVMGELCDAVSAKKYGYALLMLSYADGGEGGHRAKDYAFWLEGIYKAYNGLSPERKATICTTPVTPQTTIADVAGKVILQVNVASGLPGGDIAKGSYQDNLPALLTYVNRKRTPGTAPVSMMHWMEWKDDYRQNVGIFVNDNDDIDEAREALRQLGPDDFYCNYSIANRTQPDTGTDKDLPKYADRKKALGRILRNSALSLEIGNHNLWSVFAAGGNEASSSTSDVGDEAALAFASEMNRWILDQLNERIQTKNYGSFGNVFCNYIVNTAGDVDGQDIVNRILLMNQLFRLSRDEGRSESDGVVTAATASPLPARCASSSEGVNGWSTR